MYPGGLKETPYKDMMDKKVDEVRCFFFHVRAGEYSSAYIDHQTSRVRHVAQKQAQRQTPRTT